MPVPVSVLDLATVRPGGSVRETFDASVALAQDAERWGYRRYWFAEHHNMPTIASSATAVLIGHIAGSTSTIRVGAGGIMLPNHSPLVIAEQFGTLETLYPGRIDLGLGRAPGGDMAMLQALRRSPTDSDRFPQDVVELQALLGPERPGQTVRATPGTGTEVPLIILGSSLFGARLAAALGLPYSFASHFAPNALVDAVTTYRREYRPSDANPEPYVIVAMNVFAADTDADAHDLYHSALRANAGRLTRSGLPLSDEDADAVLASPAGDQIRHMLRHSAVGSPATVREQVEQFAAHAQADEIIVASNTPTAEARRRSYELLAAAVDLVG
ncbi:LLM class flavin-dependent oxidoreductase [Georgenia sp. EYE_87]|uniref:LLM class flavin-dependent oxidoreductase n=1 Tax=Georgenia sp. EYE_87 TaxID=2853448 RepID=UPI0020063DE8|nr:LLM class flavin-dependent oxidoreductase [Georgenia sp. EYE_87]MCK6211983.1 LLM class flavin-dependent oxidoreductase [Georgenia sp. EYE_87]